MDGYMYGCMHECMHVCIHGWMAGWLDACMHGWMDGWMDTRIANRGLLARLCPNCQCQSGCSNDDATRAPASALLLFSLSLQWVLSQKGECHALWLWILEC